MLYRSRPPGVGLDAGFASALIASKIMRLVKRRQRHQTLEICNYLGVHNYGCVVLSPAVDNPVSGANQAMIREVVFQPAQQEIERLFVACSCLSSHSFAI